MFVQCVADLCGLCARLARVCRVWRAGPADAPRVCRVCVCRVWRAGPADTPRVSAHTAHSLRTGGGPCPAASGDRTDEHQSSPQG